jgi:amino acid transporter
MTTVSPSFSRSMKMIGCLLITLSSVTPASSIFVIVPQAVKAGGTGVLLSFAGAGLVSLLIAYVYAELCSAFPLTGGEYAIVGRTLGPLAGFIILGVNMVVLLLNITVIALGLASYINALVPGTGVVMDALLCVGFTTLCAVLNVRTNALITGAFLFLELVALIVVAVLGFWHPARGFAETLLHPVFLNGAGHLAPASLNEIGLATSVAIFAFYGYGNAVYLGEETHDAPRHVARAVLWALAVAAVSEVLPLAATLVGAPDLAALFGSDNMFVDFVRVRGGGALANATNVCVALAIINADIAVVVLVSRMLFSSGRDHVWAPPVNRMLTIVSPRFGSPWAATLVTGVLAGALCFVDLGLLTVISGTTIVVVYGALCLAVIAGRRSGGTSHAFYRMPLYPWPPVLALLALAYVIYTQYLDPVVGRPSLWWALGVIAMSACYYKFVLARRGAWILYAPHPDGLPAEPALGLDGEPSALERRLGFSAE